MFAHTEPGRGTMKAVGFRAFVWALGARLLWALALGRSGTGGAGSGYGYVRPLVGTVDGGT